VDVKSTSGRQGQDLIFFPLLFLLANYRMRVILFDPSVSVYSDDAYCYYYLFLKGESLMGTDFILHFTAGKVQTNIL
jgi:hypothetical protein